MAFITIWDMDYYYSTKRVNCFNPDIMKISSYHKQKGDAVNFVLKEDDLRRAFDIMYIVREGLSTPPPPVKYFMMKNIKWWGKAMMGRINWHMSDAMLGCRPDYLLYPERNTSLERAEHIRLFNNKGEPLKWVQDWKNTFKKKEIIVTDDLVMWTKTQKNDLVAALKLLTTLEKVSFLNPIWIQKLISDKEIRNLFLSLNFKRGAIIEWTEVDATNVYAAFALINEFKEKFPTVKVGKIKYDYRMLAQVDHWQDKNQALKEFYQLVDVILTAKTRGVELEVRLPETRVETPYFILFETIAEWSRDKFKKSWLEFLDIRFNKSASAGVVNIYNRPEKWSPVFRNLLQQTYRLRDFCVLEWKDKKLAYEIPWQLIEKEFELEI